MKTLVYLTAVLFHLFNHCLNADIYQAESHYFNADGSICDSFAELLAQDGIYLEGVCAARGGEDEKIRVLKGQQNLQFLNSLFQGQVTNKIKWFGPKGKERNRLNYVMTLSQAKSIRAICWDKLAHGPEMMPKRPYYKAVVLLGAFMPTVRKRLAFLNKLIAEGLIQFDKIYVLTGFRVLEEDGDKLHTLYDRGNGIIPIYDFTAPEAGIKTETEMMKLIMKQSLNRRIDQRAVIYIDSPAPIGSKRATTESTIIDWVNQEKLDEGPYLVISNQPYITYQGLVFERVLKKMKINLDYEMAGPGIYPQERNEQDPSQIIRQASILMDNTARILFEKVQISQLG